MPPSVQQMSPSPAANHHLPLSYFPPAASRPERAPLKPLTSATNPIQQQTALPAANRARSSPALAIWPCSYWLIGPPAAPHPAVPTQWKAKMSRLFYVSLSVFILHSGLTSDGKHVPPLLVNEKTGPQILKRKCEWGWNSWAGVVTDMRIHLAGLLVDVARARRPCSKRCCVTN